jgi:hypothetical protein
MTPTVDHFLFIPATLLVGGAIGFIFGVRLTRRELERRAAARRQ